MPKIVILPHQDLALMALFWKRIAVKPFSTLRCVTVSRLNTPVKILCLHHLPLHRS